MDFPGKHLEMKMLTREGAAVQTFFFFKNVTFLTLVTRNNKRSTSTDFFWEKKVEFSIERHGIFSGLFLYISFQYIGKKYLRVNTDWENVRNVKL